LSPGGTHRWEAGGGEAEGCQRSFSIANRPVGFVGIVLEVEIASGVIQVWDNLAVRRRRKPERAGSNPATLTAR
jgi:hypothetical protein